MDATLLSRIQFGVAAGFHFLFPPTTLGLSLNILILESLYLKKGDEIYRKLSDFLIKILALVFVLGTATGITLEFSFGTNWANYSRVVGDIFGAPLAAEGVFAFFLESMFLGVLVFGRKRVSRNLFWWSSFFVFLGSHLSGLWIIIANSWMQTPAGYKMEGGVAKLTNFLQAAVNHSTLQRYLHTIAGGWITGSMLILAIASYYLLKKVHVEEARVLLKKAFAVFAIVAILQLFLGHFHSVEVAKYQPEKMAAFEALYKTQKGAPLALFGIPAPSKEKNYLYIGIPKLLSWLIYFDANAEVKGLDAFPREEWPYITGPFIFYHLMIIFGLWFILLAIWGFFLGRKITENRLFLKLLLWSVPLPYLANIFGWLAAEIGRQPWAVYHIIKTKDASSVVVPAGQVAFTLLVFTVIYTLFFFVGLHFLKRIIQKGPAGESSGY